MDIQEYLSDKKKIQKSLLDFIENEYNTEENYQNFIQIINDQKILDDVNEFRSLLHLINNISAYHNRTNDFNAKIEKILQSFKTEIQKYLTNYNLYKIFEKNKRILIYLIEENILTIDANISQMILMNKDTMQPYFFIKEIKPFISQAQIKQIEKFNENHEIDLVSFDENRRNGENENKLCYIIRNDLISEFIVYAEKNDLLLNSKIKKSIFDSNYYDHWDDLSLIEYAAFFGSIQIFTYLFKNDAYVSSYIWKFAIHSNNPELIQFLETNKFELKNEYIENCLEIAIYCHHNNIIEYMKNNYIEDQDKFNDLIHSLSLKYYNYEYIQINSFNQSNFLSLCQNDYFFIVNEIVKNKIIDTNLSCKTTNEKENITAIVKPWQESMIIDNFNISELLIKSNKIDFNEKITFCKWSKSDHELHVFDYLIYLGNVKAIQYLLGFDDIDVNFKIVRKFIHLNDEFEIQITTPLIEAIRNNSEKILEILLENPKIDVNLNKTSQSKKGLNEISPLIYAVSLKMPSMVRLLLSHKKINVNMPNKAILYDEYSQHNAIHEAIINNNIDILNILLSHPEIDVNALKTKKKVNSFIESEMNALSLAVDDEKEEIVQILLLQKNIDVNYRSFYKENKIKSYTPILHNAIKKENLNIVKFLLANPEIDVNLKSLIKTSQKDTIEEYEGTALECAIISQNIEIIKLLLSHPKIDVNLKSTKKMFSMEDFFIEERTPLQIAVYENKVESLQFVINYSKMNNQLKKESLNELIGIANDKHMKSLIYSYL